MAHLLLPATPGNFLSGTLALQGKLTRYYQNGSIFYARGQRDFWGYCLPGCDDQEGVTLFQQSVICLLSQAAGSRNKYNLALSPGLWRSGLYDLRTWEAGLCHTYSPASTSKADRMDRMAVLLGNFSQIRDFYYFHGFDIYIHEKVKNTIRLG